MRDYKHYGRPVIPRKTSYWTREGFMTLAAFAAVIACFTLMGWSCVEREAMRPLSLSIEDTKPHIMRQVDAIKRDQDKFTAEMEKRVIEGAKK